MVRVHEHNSLLLSQDPKGSTLLPPHLSMKPEVRRALVPELVGGDANDWLIGVNWLRRKEEYRESYWKGILSKLPQMASESRGLRLQTQAIFLGESQNNSLSQRPSLKFPWLYLTDYHLNFKWRADLKFPVCFTLQGKTSLCITFLFHDNSFSLWWEWDGWMASSTQWTLVWVKFGRWWRTGNPGKLHSMGSQRVRHNWVTEQQQF